MRIAPEGRWFIAGAWLIAFALVVAAVRAGTPGWWVGGGPWLLLALWVVAFFRDPVRRWCPRGGSCIIAPADGKVVSIVDVDEPAFLAGARPGSRSS